MGKGMAENDPKRDEQQDEGLKVTDRRLFTSDGQLRGGMPEDDERAEAEPESPEPSSEHRGGSEQTGFEHRPVEEPQGVDFTMLINAMAQPALIFLGEVAHPGSGRAEVNLEQARLQIDLLDLLRIKSRGNLTHEEEGLLERILYQLRMLYVSRSSQPGPQ